MLAAQNRNISIDVSHPFKKTGNLGAFFVYKLTTDSNLPGFNGQSSVERRYNDFAWIADQLANDFPGSIIPPIPEKEVFGASNLGLTTQEQIAARTRGLKTYLHRVVAQRQLFESQKFVKFLQVNNCGLKQLKNEAISEKKPHNITIFRSLTLKKVRNGLINDKFD